MADRYDKLAPNDIVITLRSLRRRFASVVGVVQSNPESLARADEVGPTGHSLGQSVDHTAQVVKALATETIATARRSNPSISSAAIVAAATPAANGTAQRQTIDRGTASIGDDAEALAETLDGLDADGWARIAQVDDGSTTDLVSLARATVRASIEGLRDAETIATWLRA